MANFKGFKQVLAADYNSLSVDEKKGYMWLVRENKEATDGAIYFGSRLYANSTADVDLSGYYTKDEVDAALVNKLEASDLEEYAKTTDVSAISALVADVMNLIGLTVSEDSISLVLGDSFEGADSVVAALELLASKLAAHEAAAEQRISDVEGKLSGLGIGTVDKDGKTFVQLKSGEEVIDEFDASQFLVDGMLSNATLEGNNLILSFNTDSGKQDITVDLSGLIKAYVFDETQFVVDGQNISLNEDYIKGLISAAQSGLTVKAGDGVKVEYTTDEQGGAVVTVSAKVDEAKENNLLVMGDRGLYVVLSVEGDDAE